MRQAYLSSARDGCKLNAAHLLQWAVDHQPPELMALLELPWERWRQQVVLQPQLLQRLELSDPMRQALHLARTKQTAQSVGRHWCE